MVVTEQEVSETLVPAARLAESLQTKGLRISASGVRAAARRGAIPYVQARVGGAMLFSVAAVDESGYTPNAPRGVSQHVRCANPRCKRGPDGGRAVVVVTGYARRYASHFCSAPCKYEAPGAWNPGGGRKGFRSTTWRARFLTTLAAGSSIAAAAERAGVAKATAYRHRAADLGFRADWDAALSRGGGGALAYWSDPARSGKHRVRLRPLCAEQGRRAGKSWGRIARWPRNEAEIAAFVDRIDKAKVTQHGVHLSEERKAEIAEDARERSREHYKRGRKRTDIADRLQVIADQVIAGYVESGELLELTQAELLAETGILAWQADLGTFRRDFPASAGDPDCWASEWRKNVIERVRRHVGTRVAESLKALQTAAT